MAALQTADGNARAPRRDYGFSHCLCGKIDASHIVVVCASDSVNDLNFAVATLRVLAPNATATLRSIGGVDFSGLVTRGGAIPQQLSILLSAKPSRRRFCSHCREQGARAAQDNPALRAIAPVPQQPVQPQPQQLLLLQQLKLQQQLHLAWVRKNFTSAFVRKVRGARGQFVHIDTARPRPEVAAQPGELGGADGAVLPAPLPSIAYRQYEATFCAAYGPASAVHWYGDADVAALVAAAARAVLSSPDQISFVHDLINTEAPGWQAQYLVKHDPLVVKFSEPVVLQLACSDGSDNHAVATVGDLVFDSAEQNALPLSRQSLDRCAGLLTDGTKFSHVARAVRLLPGKSVKKQLRRSGALRVA
jgi:hypothetical protein